MIEREARTAEAAIEELCKELNRSREELDIEVVEEGSRGLLGFVGSKKVKVRARIKGQDEGGAAAIDDGFEYAKTVVERIVEAIVHDAEVEGYTRDERIHLNIKTRESGLLIGRHGQTLDAVQYLVAKIVGKRMGERRVVIVDSEEYRDRKREALEELAREMGERAKSTGRVVKLKPMTARDRRVVHLALKGDRELETKSQGDGELRRIKIIPRSKGGRECST